MFDASCHRSLVKRSSLVSADHSHCHAGIQIGIFPAPFGNPAPARVTGNVEHRGESPACTLRRSFHRGNAGTLFNQFRIEGSSQAEWNREYGMVAVDDVPAYEQGNAQAGFFDGDMLISIDLLRIHFVED